MKSVALAVILGGATLCAQVGWTQDAPMGRALANGLMWCDTSVTPNEVFAFGGSEYTVDVSRYHKTATGWQWSDSGYDAPAMYVGTVMGAVQEWTGGRAEFMTKDSQGRDVNRAICISGTMFQFGGLIGKPLRSVWSFKRGYGFERMKENPVLGPLPPDDRDFTSCYVPYDASNPQGSGRIYRFGVYSGPIASATNDMWVLDRTNPGEVTWTRLKAMGGSPPPPLAHATLVYTNGLLLLSGGMRYELGAPISEDMWITFPFPVAGRQFWIRLPKSNGSSVKWKGCSWFQSGAFLRFGATGRHDRPSFNHFEILPFGWTSWWRVPQQYARPPSRWMCSGTWIPSEQCYLMGGGIRVPGLNGGVDLYQDSWRFKL